MESSQKKIWNSSSIPDDPHMEQIGIDRLKSRLVDCKVFLEYGAGGSTMAAAFQRVDSIYSVESDSTFLSAVKDRLSQLEDNQSKFFPVYADVGPTGDWGAPTDPAMAVRWPNYAVQVWGELFKSGESPDLILIDGRFRVACFLASLMFAKEGAIILFDDYVDRPHYHSVESFLKPVSEAGRMAEFIVPPSALTNRMIIELVKTSTRAE